MTSNTKHVSYFLPLAIAVGLLSAGHTTSAHAQTLTSEGNAAGAQCVGNDVNDSGIEVGTCTPGNQTGPSVAWVALTAGTQTPLPPLVTGQSCTAGGITNDGEITGSCINANDVPIAVTWNAATPANAPVERAPLGGLLGLGADVRSQATGYNQKDNVIGVSVNGSGNGTSVVWVDGSSTPIAVSTQGDNCAAVDVNDTLVNGEPSVALDCPNASGTVTAKIAEDDALLGGYQANALPIPSGADYCTVNAINDEDEMSGTCYFPAPAVPETAYWATPTSTPTLLTTLSGGPRNQGMFLNNLGHVVFSYQTATGQTDSGFWNPATGVVTSIPTLTGGAQAIATAFADDDAVVLNCEDGSETSEACVWTPSTTTTADGFIGGGDSSECSAISQDGGYIACSGENSSESNVAAVATGP